MTLVCLTPKWTGRVSLASDETVRFLYQTGSYDKVLAEMILAQSGKAYIVGYITPAGFGIIRTLESAARLCMPCLPAGMEKER